jgi:cytoskeletal protein CcmA (bactofilin family)
MFSRKKDTATTISSPPPAKAQTKSASSNSLSIISSDVTITGDIVSLGDVQIEGAINGNLRARSVVVGGEANIHGEIAAEEVIVRGYIKGEIRGERVTLSPGCLVIGNIFHKLLTIETGADFDGRCNRCEEPLAKTAIDQNSMAEKNAAAAAMPKAETPKTAPANKKATSTVGAFSPAAARAEIASLGAPDTAQAPSDDQEDEIDALTDEDEAAEASTGSRGQKTKRRVIGTHLAPRPAYAKSSSG